MKRLYVRILTAIITFTFGVAGVSLYVFRRHPFLPQKLEASTTINNPLAPITEIAPSAYPEAASIRSIDFRNYTYPGSTYGQYRNYYPEQTFTLRQGKWGDWSYGMTLLDVSYGDVTGDGVEEAILNFRQETEGSAGQNSVYIYTVENRLPKLLWAFTSGDRSEGGLRKVYTRGGRLVVELYGKGTRIEGSAATSSSEFSGMCCARSITRTQYEWANNGFRQYDEDEVFPNPEAEHWK